jgi:DNA-directed RNA polymerase subunit RPC12/RpoP
MDKDTPAVFTWIYYHDGRVWTNCTPDLKPRIIQKEPVEEPSPEIPPQPSTEHPLFYDYDKLIAESGWPYSQWWSMWKRIHPEWALVKEEVKEPEIPPPAPKPKATVKPQTCKRCGRTWTPRSNKPPVQCPKCHSPYWNRERVKRN